MSWKPQNEFYMLNYILAGDHIVVCITLDVISLFLCLSSSIILGPGAMWRM